MRVLVDCRDCKRRYDASRHEAGARFRCHCGTVVTVQPPKGHDAAVIRCSSCGGARGEGGLRCGYCKAEFTIQERDLHTVCPGCLARVSDRAKFCAHCGATLTADVLAGDVSEVMCPLCDNKVQLSNRYIKEAQVSFLECRMCAGLWVGTSSFVTLREKHKEKGEVGLSIERTPRMKRQLPGNEAKVRYRNCPVCDRMMNRWLYGTGSGVIIDICRQHGIWFDDGELRQILEWIRLGGRSDRPIAVQRREEKITLAAEDRPVVTSRKGRGETSFLDSMFGQISGVIEDLFD